ncbi:hypothetical protein PHJA_000397600 [Phtheirospermum japonicum]|uniref:Uncharacterized protein n=1 Tax=Phtheirospermum japonicum TaxID=374723 RepID=A0A830B6E3_9LAMI|nr:hypothetical protein PHJA_000397600 [Phtheirospermum japonicum]
MYEADLLRALQEDEELCMNAVCALYRQQAQLNNCLCRIFLSGRALAEYLIGGDRELRLRKSVSEVKKERPDVISRCRKLATIYVEKLFQIYCEAGDPIFGQS